MPLRQYQDRFAAAIFAHLADRLSTLGVMATGLGKTIVFSYIADVWPGPLSMPPRVLVLAHREELVFQAAEKIREATGHDPGVEMAGDHVDRDSACKVVVASVPTLTRPARLEKFRPAEFGLVVTDEAHHATAASYRRIFTHFREGNPAVRLLGVTATPKRADDLALGQVFDSVCFDYGIEPAIGDGWLVPVTQRVVKVDGLDFSAARTVAGDFNEADLEAIISREEVLHGVAVPTVEWAGGRPTIVFCVSVAHAKSMCEILNRYRDGSAGWLCGATDKNERRKTLAEFRAGKLRFLCNVGVLLEGFDAPACACIAMARPTKSLTLYTQAVGRGTRPLPGVLDGLERPDPAISGPDAAIYARLRAEAEAGGESGAETVLLDFLEERGFASAERRRAIERSGKPSLLVLDFAGNAGRHKIVTCADLLGGKYAPEVRDYARQTLEEEAAPAPVAEALERADAELDFLREESEREAAEAREREARRLVTARAHYRTYESSPFGGVAGAGDGPRRGPEPATEKQVWLLHRRFGVPLATARAYGKRQASAVIDSYMAREAVT